MINRLSREELLINANRKLYSNHSDDVKDLLPYMTIEDYVLLLYNECSPSVYGKLFEKKIIRDMISIGLPVEGIDKKWGLGDLMLSYPQKRNIVTNIDEKVDGSSVIHSLKIGMFNLLSHKYEIKFSYLGKNLSYCIKNIRLYQDVDFYLMAFVDVYDDFKIHYTCLKKESLNFFTLTPMMGTLNSSKNENIDYSITVKEDSLNYSYLMKELNVLKGNRYEHVIKFLSDNSLMLRTEFINNLCEDKIYNKKKLLSLNSDSNLFDINSKINKIVESF